jgi:hypothetical protein
MQPQFIIYFNSEGQLFQAEVKAFDLEGSIVYDVYYSLYPDVQGARRVQVYAGKGIGQNIYWRQRITSANDQRMPVEFIEAIGQGIEQANQDN